MASRAGSPYLWPFRGTTAAQTRSPGTRRRSPVVREEVAKAVVASDLAARDHVGCGGTRSLAGRA